MARALRRAWVFMAHEPDLIHFKLGDHRDPDYLRKVLTAHFNHERMRSTRRFCVGLLAILGAGLWLSAIWPGLLPARVHTVGVQLWGFCMVGTVAVGIFEWKWYRRRERLMRDNESPDHDRHSPP